MGLFSGIKDAIKKVGQAIRGALDQALNIAKEALNRAFGALDFIGTLLGLIPKKKLRLRVVILRDGDGTPLTDAADVQPTIDRAREIFKQELNTDITAAGGILIEHVDAIPPSAALNPGCGSGAWGDHYGEAGDFYSLHIATNAAAAPTGYATPVTAFIVCNVRGEKGCSLGPLTNYITLDLDGIALENSNPDDDVSVLNGAKWLAHEIGHSCGLWHAGGSSNLMDPEHAGGVKLRRWQKAIARNSRHITFL